MRIALYLLVLIASVASTTIGMNEAHADTIRFSMAAQGCTVDQAAVGKLESNASGGMQFSGSNTGTVYLMCPVAVYTYASPCGGTKVGLTSVDPDGNSFVRAWLNALPIATNAVGTVTSVTSTQHTKNHDTVTTAHAFNFDFQYYYFVIEMNRTNSTSNPIFYGVYLADINVC